MAKIGITVILHSAVVNFSRRIAVRRRYEFVTMLSHNHVAVRHENSQSLVVADGVVESK